ncbi:hypothetical protein BX600DRAFT_478054 [Xylariales sp. PMI_506]|nr:hypothetical protein BX600DRAFT_478054 [Xylariales sp. PMI_506]
MATNNQNPRPRIQYKKLNWSKGEVRFLELQPASAIDEPVVCRLVVHSLHEDSEFVAISSLLGDTAQTEKITINNFSIVVPAHISRALKHVRAVFYPYTSSMGVAISQKSSKSPRWLQHLLRHFGSGINAQRESPLRIWIDCLCLNSEDLKEKSQQKAIMSRVYWKAKTVVGWVGLKIPQTDAGIALIRDFDEAMPQLFQEPGDRELHPENYSPYHEWAKPIIHHFDPSSEAALGTADFLNRPFFKRRWIIEEMALAKVSSFLIGDAIVSWNQLLRLNLAMEEFKEYESDVCPAETRPMIHEFPLETIHVLLDEFEKRKRLDELNGLNRSLTPSIKSTDASERSTIGR